MASSAQPSLTLLSPTLRRQAHTRIVAVLPRGEAIRNFVYSDCLRRVADNADLRILSVFSSPEVLAQVQSISDDVCELSSPKERWPVLMLREILDMAHGRRLWSEAARVRWELRDSEATTPAMLAKRWAKKLACYPFASDRGLRLLSSIERTASRRLRTTDEYLTAYKRYRPSLVFNGSHVHGAAAMQAVQAAQWLGIPTATFIFSWDNLTSQGRIMPPYDYYLVWTENIRSQLLRIYPSVKPEQVIVTGTPQFDAHFASERRWTREKFCRYVGADPSRPIILYSTGMPNHMPGEPEIVEALANVVRRLTSFGPPQLLVRVYPKDLTNRFNNLRDHRKDILFPVAAWDSKWLTPRQEDSELLINTLYHCSAGINIASTISLELCMFDKPVINIAYDPPGNTAQAISFSRYYSFDHYKPLVDCGAVTLACSAAELEDLLVSSLENPASRSPQRAALLHQMFGETLDGKSGHRIANVLVALASRTRGPRDE